jgi:hypothetical protein
MVYCILFCEFPIVIPWTKIEKTNNNIRYEPKYLTEFRAMDDKASAIEIPPLRPPKLR